MNLFKLFFGYCDNGYCVFCVLCDSDLEVEEEVEDLVCEFEIVLKCCCWGSVIWLKIMVGVFVWMCCLIMQELQVVFEEMVEVEGLLGMVDLCELVLDLCCDL